MGLNTMKYPSEREVDNASREQLITWWHSLPYPTADWERLILKSILMKISRKK
jgi:hypothetical protein